MKFSVKLLLGIIALCAVTVSALLGPHEKALRFLGTTTLLLGLAAAIIAAVGSGKSRVFAVGFLIGCLPYLYLAFGNNGTSRRYLASEVALEILDREYKLSEPRKTPNGETVHILSSGMVVISTPLGFGRNRSISMTHEQAGRLGHLKYAYKEDLLPKRTTYMLIGHFAVAMILGFAGGALAVYVNKPAK